MKTAKQIKQGLTECAYAHGSCGLCPYDRPGNGVACQRELKEDSLALIKQLESTYSQVSKALCVKDSATLEEILAAVDQLKPRWISVEERLSEWGLTLEERDDNNHRELVPLIMFGHVELFTPEMREAYLAWCQTDEGKQYLVGGSKYKEE